jgi:hypothetical protein
MSCPRFRRSVRFGATVRKSCARCAIRFCCMRRFPRQDFLQSGQPATCAASRAMAAGLPNRFWAAAEYACMCSTLIRRCSRESLTMHQITKSSDGTFNARAVLVAACCRAGVVVMSEQLIGRPWTNAGPFQYAGSIGPLVGEELATANALVNQIARIGEVLAAAFRLIGLFGVDGIVDGEHFWPVEVNPRYAASCEIIERLTGINAVAVHAAACERGALPVVNDLQPTNRAAGKLIVFATRESVYSEAAANWVRECNTNVVLPCIADIPDMGTRFTAGQPIATVNAEGETTAEVRRRLIGFSDDLRNRLS